MGKLVVIEGNIGIGKSTLADKLHELLKGSTRLVEPVDGNLALAEFYKDPKRWSFALQMDYLYKRFEQHYEANAYDGLFIMDRGIVGDKVFVNVLYDSDDMNFIEVEIYENTRNILLDLLEPADMYIYLRGTPERAFAQIQKRSRSIEDGIPLEYLQTLDKAYMKEFFEEPSAFLRESQIIDIEWNMENENQTRRIAQYIMEQLHLND